MPFLRVGVGLIGQVIVRLHVGFVVPSHEGIDVLQFSLLEAILNRVDYPTEALSLLGAFWDCLRIFTIRVESVIGRNRSGLCREE